MECSQIGFIPDSVSSALMMNMKKKLRNSCEKDKELKGMHSHWPPGTKYYCCDPHCWPDPPIYTFNFNISSKLTRKIFEKGGKITLANGNLTLEITEVKITKKQDTKIIIRTKKQKTSTKRIPKKTSKTKSTTSKRRK